MCVIVLMQYGSISLSRFIGNGLNSQDFFLLDMILLEILPLWGVKIALIVVCCWLVVWILHHHWIHLLFFVFFQWRSLQSHQPFLHVTCDQGSGFSYPLLVMLLTTGNSFFVSLSQTSIFLVIVYCLWYVISQSYGFLSLVYAIQWWGCLYWLHALCLDLTVFCWLLVYLLNHSCLGLSEDLIVFSGVVFSSALCSSVLSLWHAWSRESLVSRIRTVKLVSNASAVILVLSLIVSSILGYLSLCSWRSIETMQLSDMYPCAVALVTLTSLCSCVKMRSSLFPSLCLGMCTCCSSLRAAIVSLNIVVSALMDSLVLMLKSCSIMTLSSLVILSVRRLVISSMNFEVVIWLSMLGWGDIGLWCSRACFCG